MCRAVPGSGGSVPCQLSKTPAARQRRLPCVSLCCARIWWFAMLLWFLFICIFALLVSSWDDDMTGLVGGENNFALLCCQTHGSWLCCAVLSLIPKVVIWVRSTHNRASGIGLLFYLPEVFLGFWYLLWNTSSMPAISATDQISNLFLYSGMVDYHQEQLQPQFKSRVSFCSWLFGY